MNKLRNIGPLLLVALITACAGIKPGNDPVVVRAEQVTKASMATIDTFLKYEYDNRLLLQIADPKIKAAADAMRVQAPQVFMSARTLTKAYKANRTAENKASLNTLVAVLEKLASEASTYIAKYAN